MDCLLCVCFRALNRSTNEILCLHGRVYFLREICSAQQREIADANCWRESSREKATLVFFSLVAHTLCSGGSPRRRTVALMHRYVQTLGRWFWQWIRAGQYRARAFRVRQAQRQLSLSLASVFLSPAFLTFLTHSCMRRFDTKSIWFPPQSAVTRR